MSPFRRLANAWPLALAAVVLVSCRPDVATTPDSPIKLYQGGQFALLDSASARDSATKFMTAAGCTATVTNRPTGMLAIPVPQNGTLVYDCHLLGKDSTHQVFMSYMTREHGWTAGDHLAENNYWELGSYQVSCSTGMVYVPAGQTYVVYGPDGHFISSGRAPSQGEDVVLDDSACQDGSTGYGGVFEATAFDNTGTPIDPTPPFTGDDTPAGGPSTIAPAGGGKGNQGPPPDLVSMDLSASPTELTVGSFSNLTASGTFYSDMEGPPADPSMRPIRRLTTTSGGWTGTPLCQPESGV